MAEFYKGDTLGSFPDPTVPNINKDKSYILQFIIAGYTSWKTNGNSSFYANRARKLTANSYRMGQQDATKLKDLVNLKGEITEINVNYDPIPIVARFADVIVNNILNNNYKLTIELADNISVEKKDEYRGKLGGKMVGADMSELITQITGVDVTEEDIPDDEEEIMLRMAIDYRDDDEISLLSLINNIKTTNNWTDIERSIIEDVVAYNEIVVRHEIDKKQGITIQYVHDLNFIRSTSQERDNHELQYAGEIKTVTFAKLRTMIKAEDGINDDDLFEIAKIVSKSSSAYANANWDDPIYTDNLYGNNRWYDELSLDIVYMEFIDVDYDLYEKKETSLGLPVIHKRHKDYRLPAESKYPREMFTDTYQVVRKGTWIKGTEYIINAGKANNILLEGKDLSRARLNYTVYTIQGKSMVERMIPYADQMWITHIKHQQLMAKLRPTGVAINVTALEEALFVSPEKAYEPIDLMNYYDITGNVLYRDDDEEEGITKRGNPITPMDNRMGSQLMELTNVYNHNLEIIRDMTNVSKFMDGSQVAAKTAVGVQQQGIQQSNMGIDHLKYAHEFAVLDSAKVLFMMIQDIFKYSALKDAYSTVIGEYSMGVIERLKNIPMEQLNIKMKYGMTDLERAELIKSIDVAIAAKEITIADRVMVMEIDDTKLANKMLMKRRKVLIKEREKQEQQRHEQTKELESQKSQSAAQLVEQTAMVQAQADIMVHQNKTQIDDQTLAIEHQQEMELMDKEYGYKLQIADKNVQSQDNKLKTTEDGKDKRNKDTKTMESNLAYQRENNESPQNFNAPPQPRV